MALSLKWVKTSMVINSQVITNPWNMVNLFRAHISPLFQFSILFDILQQVLKTN